MDKVPPYTAKVALGLRNDLGRIMVSVITESFRTIVHLKKVSVIEQEMSSLKLKRRLKR